MSRVTRLALAVLVSLGVLVGIYTSVDGASFSDGQDRMGAHLVSGPMVNLDHYRVANPTNDLLQSEFQSGKGHGCDSEKQASPDD